MSQTDGQLLQQIAGKYTSNKGAGSSPTLSSDGGLLNSLLDKYLNKKDSMPSLSSDPWGQFKQKASQIATQRGFPSNVMLAQAANESARGESAPGNNFFGIKGAGNAGSSNLPTQEYGNNGYYGENSNFAAYQTPEDSVNAYLDLVLSYPGVPQAVATGDPNQVIQAIENAGYATSPTYVQNIEATPEFRGTP